MKSKISTVILAAILTVGLSVNMGTVFADDSESYEVKQKIEIEIDCDQKNENDDSPFAELGNEQACIAEAQNINDVVPPAEPVEQ